MRKSSRVQIFPYYLSRVCGGPIDEFNSLNFPNLNDFIKQHNDINNNLSKINKQITDELYILIPKIKESALRNILLTVKRDVHNLRSLSPRAILQLKPLIPQTIGKKINKYIRLLNNLNNWEEQKELIYSNNITEINKALLKLAQNVNFLNGLLLASSNFYKELKFYLEKTDPKDEKKINLTLTKYLSRFYFKTSPFSTFTSVNLSSLNNKNNIKKPLKLVSFIRLNNYIFHYIKLSIQAKKEIAQLIPLRLNSTISKQGNDYIFLANDANREAVQRIKSNPFLDFIYKLFSAKKNLTLKLLIQTIQPYTTDKIPCTEVKNYIKKLIDYDFIEYYWGISELDPEWNNKLINLLGSFKENNEIKKIISNLIQINKILSKYPTASIAVREEIIKSLASEIQQIDNNLIQDRSVNTKKQLIKNTPHDHKNPEVDNVFKMRHYVESNLKPYQLIFEDTKHEISFPIPAEKCREIVAKISYIADSFSLNNHLLNDHENMFYYFSKKYGLDAKVELLRFYEDYSRKNVSKNKNSQNPYSKKRHALIKKNLAKIIALLKYEKQNFNDEIKLDKKHLQVLSRDKNLEHNRLFKKSLSAHIQIFNNTNNSLISVMNRTSLGYGKMFSRFLYMLDPQITGIFRSWNVPEDKDYLYVENIDASNYNFNMHPSLMPSELVITSDQYNLSEKSHVFINDLLVFGNKKTNRLELLHKISGQKVLLFDLGFENLMGRSGLFNFLSSFLVIHCIQDHILLEEINGTNFNDKSAINIQPRIIFKEQIILQRKTWVVDKKILPLRNFDESEADYFFRVNFWTQKVGLPVEVFIQSERGNNKQIKKNVLPDDYKPQYINFSNPFLVSLFNKIISKTESKILIAEMLPKSSETFSINNKRFVTEFLFQWYN